MAIAEKVFKVKEDSIRPWGIVASILTRLLNI